ncbi:MAG: hypothetical protein M3356_03210 [Actinomycetota bacterium]|nr:hypothetical protein [Actinomycetota bacterium]
MRGIGLFAALVAAAPAGCSGEDEVADRTDPAPPGAAEHAARERTPAPLRSASCPPESINCRAARGRIVFVERVDPDGDGDAHFVLASRGGLTAPGITVVDVRRDLRPRPLPGPGDRLSAAGPVYTGSYGQRQIEATEVFVRER